MEDRIALAERCAWNCVEIRLVGCCFVLWVESRVRLEFIGKVLEMWLFFCDSEIARSNRV